MISDSTFTAMAKETAEKVDQWDADKDAQRYTEKIIEAALHAVAALQREQDAKTAERWGTLPGSISQKIATAIRATPETPR